MRGLFRQIQQFMPIRSSVSWAVRVVQLINDKNLSLIAAGIAFYGLLSLVPAITALVALAGVLGDPQDLVNLPESTAAILPADASRIVEAQVVDVLATSDGVLSFAAALALAVALYSASRAMENLSLGLHVAHGVRNERSFLRSKVRVLAMTIGAMLAFVLCLGLVGALPAVLAVFAPDSWADTIVSAARWPVLFVIALVAIATLYRFAPGGRVRAARRGWISLGAVLACALWVFASFAFSYYVQSFGAYNETFGALAGVIVLLTWMWITAFILLVGAAVDAERRGAKTWGRVGTNRPAVG